MQRRPIRGVFVTGTDTGVGKTVVSALLTLGLDGCYWKPVQSGSIEGTDRATVALWTELPASRLLAESYCLKLPVSPHLAALAEGVHIELRRCRPPVVEFDRPLVVEGAGGVLVPINGQALMIDLIARLGWPVVLVARSTLGTINHTLLSLEALRRRRIPVAGIVVNGPANPENERALREYGGVRRLARLTPLSRLDAPALRAAFRGGFAGWHDLPAAPRSGGVAAKSRHRGPQRG